MHVCVTLILSVTAVKETQHSLFDFLLAKKLSLALAVSNEAKNLSLQSTCRVLFVLCSGEM